MKSPIATRLKQSVEIPVQRVNLTDDFRRELNLLVKNKMMSESLSSAIIYLVERRVFKRDHAFSELPIVTEEIVSSIRSQTDRGVFFLNNKPFQLCALKAKDDKPPHLTMVCVENSLYRVYPI